MEILGVDLIEDIPSVPKNDYDIFYTNLYSGIGCVVPIRFKIDCGDDNTFIQRMNIVTEYPEDGSIKTVYKRFDEVIKPFNTTIIEYDFNLLFKNANNYSIAIEVVMNNGFTYSRRFNNIKILDDTYSDINIYKLEKLTHTEMNEILNGKSPNWNYFAFTTDKAQAIWLFSCRDS